MRDAVELGIRELSVFSFSTENWSRPAEEVESLVRMFGERIAAETPELNQEGVRMRFIGRREGIDTGLVERMQWAETMTKDNGRITLFVAFNYGAGRRSSMRRGTSGWLRGRVSPSPVRPEMHDPDLLIRTSGEQRDLPTTCSGSAPTQSWSSGMSCGRNSRVRL